jgi:hypothetical protein
VGSEMCIRDRIIPSNKGVFCYNGKGCMNDTDIDGAKGNVGNRYSNESSLPCNFGGISLGESGEEIELTTIDEMNVTNIGFIHCDAQGAEPFIFSKGIDLIKRDMPVIFFEDNVRFGKYLYLQVCKSYPEYADYSDFSIEDYCIDELGYSKCIINFDNSGDTLLVP